MFMRLLTILLLAGAAFSQPAPLPNPLLPSGADPWVTVHEGWFFYMHTTGRDLTVWKTRSLGDLARAEHRVVWRPPASGPYSRNIWAPELHRLDGRWYIYFAADNGRNEMHRVWVLENAAGDPLAGEWVMKGKLADASDKWAIDASVFEHRGRRYVVWSGWEGDTNIAQNIYIAELANPWTVKGRRVRLSGPEYPWEKIGDLTRDWKPEENPGANTARPLHVDVNEGPQILHRNGRLFLIYSAAGCWTDFYSLGMLTAREDADLLDAASWTKSPVPVFWQSPSVQAYGTGHNSFFRTPDGQDWLLYHANSGPGQGCGGRRNPRAQPFTWNADGTPNFGRPLPPTGTRRRR